MIRILAPDQKCHGYVEQREQDSKIGRDGEGEYLSFVQVAEVHGSKCSQ